MKTAVIAGASGLVGKQLMFKLLENNIYDKVISFVRRNTTISHPKLEEIVVNFDALPNLTFADEVHFFCCLGTTIKKAGSQDAFYKVDYQYVYNFALLANQSALSKFLLISALGADANSTIFYNKVKGDIERDIMTLPISSIFIFRPSLLVGNREEFRFGEKIGIVIANLLSIFLMGSLSKYKPTHAVVLAEKMIEKANNEELRGKFYVENDEIIS